MSVFLEGNHLILRNPRGGVEDVEAFKRAGFGSLFCNIGDHAPHEWYVIRERAKALRMPCGPWLRTAMGDNEFAPEKVDYLLDIAEQWDSPLIVNSESEIKATGAETTTWLSRMCYDRDWALSMECWPFADVDWSPIALVLPQIFPQDSETARDEEGCLAEWHRVGVPCVVPTYGAYHEWDPNFYARLTPYGVYAADDMGGEFNAWGPLGAHDPCIEEENMPTIGSQDGIKAATNRLRTLDPGGTALKVNADGSWPDISTLPEDLGTWRAYDKLQRTLQILKDDHDA